jgi:hypothetical protein
MVFSEVRIERETKEPVFLTVEHFQFTAGHRGTQFRFPHLEHSADLIEKDAPVRSQMQLHRLRHARSEYFHFETVIGNFSACVRRA